MFTKKFAFASAALAAYVFVLPVSNVSADANHIGDATQCAKVVEQTKEFRKLGPTVGDRAAQIFDSLIVRANELCDAKEYSQAAKVLNQARGTIVSEN